MAERKIVLNETSERQDESLQSAPERAESELARLKALAASQTQSSHAEPGTGASRTIGHATSDPSLTGTDALREDSMMRHLFDSLEQGTDIGHYGRLVFAMVARHFMEDAEVIAELTKDRDFGEEQAAALLHQVESKDYNPPRRDRILEWQTEQEFPLLPNPNDPDCGNVYRSLHFPEATYKHIEQYQEERTAGE